MLTILTPPKNVAAANKYNTIMLVPCIYKDIAAIAEHIIAEMSNKIETNIKQDSSLVIACLLVFVKLY